MLKIGVILLLIGLAILSPFDDIIWYALLVPCFGLGVIPLIIGIGLVFLIAGATITGIHILPLITNPIIFIMIIIALIIVVYLVIIYELVPLDIFLVR